MKPFNLERALAGDPVVTRDGRPVKIAGYNPDANEDCRILGWIIEDGEWGTMDWWDDGQYMLGNQTPSDLSMSPTEHKEWIVRSGKGDWVSGPFKTFKHAESCVIDWGHGTIHEITITE